jgi:hypothetical protein
MTAASVLSAYANSLLLPTLGSAAALEYLVRIPNKLQACKQVAKFIAQTGETQLIGTLDGQGVQTTNPVVLKQEFAPAQLDSILNDAAVQTDKPAVAAMCYMLAGQYTNVLHLLNQQLSPPDQASADRQFWVEQTLAFHKTYLESSSTRVYQVLKNNEKEWSVVITNKTLLDLNTLFRTMQQQQRIDWEVVNRLGLLPTSQADLASKESAYHSTWDPLIQQALSSLIMAVVSALYQEHRGLKPQVDSSSSSGVVRERLHEIQAKARLYVTFARLVGIPSEQTERLSRLEVLMI